MQSSETGGAELVLRGGHRIPLPCSKLIPRSERHAWHQQVVAHVNRFLEQSLGRVVLVESDARPSALVLPAFCDWTFTQRAAYADARRAALAAALHGGATLAQSKTNTHLEWGTTAQQRLDAVQARLAAARTTAAELLSQLCPRHPIHRERRAGAFQLRRTVRGVGLQSPHGCARCRTAPPGTASALLRSPAPWWDQTASRPAIRIWLLLHALALLGIYLYAKCWLPAHTRGGDETAFDEPRSARVLLHIAMFVALQIVMPGSAGPYLVLDDASGAHAQWRVEVRQAPLSGLLQKAQVPARGTAAQAWHAEVRLALRSQPRWPHAIESVAHAAQRLHAMYRAARCSCLVAIKRMSTGQHHIRDRAACGIRAGPFQEGAARRVHHAYLVQDLPCRAVCRWSQRRLPQNRGRSAWVQTLTQGILPIGSRSCALCRSQTLPTRGSVQAQANKVNRLTRRKQNLTLTCARAICYVPRAPAVSTRSP